MTTAIVSAMQEELSAVLPLLQLDRIYVRGFSVRDARVHHGHPWARISDHAALSATLARL